MIVLPSEMLLAAFNAGRSDDRTAQALHRVQAAVLFAQGHAVPDGALPAELRARIEALRAAVHAAPPRHAYDERLTRREVGAVTRKMQREAQR